MPFNPDKPVMFNRKQSALVDDGLKSPPAPERVRVLVVDDVMTMRNLISVILRSLGFQRVQEAESGEAALRRLQAGGIDLLITDWDMPGMNGVELIEQVRRDPHYGQIPILMVSAEAKRPNIAQALANGVDGYIVKPFTTTLLSERLAQVLYRKRAVLEKRWAGESTGTAAARNPPRDPVQVTAGRAVAAAPETQVRPWKPGATDVAGGLPARSASRAAEPMPAPRTDGLARDGAAAPAGPAAPAPTPDPTDPAGPTPRKFKLSSI